VQQYCPFQLSALIQITFLNAQFQHIYSRSLSLDTRVLLHIHTDHITFHTQLTPVLPLLLVHHMVFGTRVITSTGQFGSGSNSQLILTLVIHLGVVCIWMDMILHHTTGGCTSSQKCCRDDCCSCHANSKSADVV